LELYKVPMYFCEGLAIGKFVDEEATPQQVLLNIVARLS